MKFLREPLLHFLVIGGAFFGVFHLAGGDSEPHPDEIVVSAGQIANLEAIFSSTWQRPPNAEEMQALVSEYVRDEVFYREGVAMGLDRDDTVVRRRVRQKMEFVADLAADVEPTDAELKAFVADNPDHFRDEPRFSFTHVYFQGGEKTPKAEEIERLRLALNAGTTDSSAAGDPFMAGFDFSDLRRSEIAEAFGEAFALGIERTNGKDWQGPFTSAYGTHLVHVSDRVAARDLPFEHVRQAARREWLHGRKVAANDALYEKLRSRYVIKVEDISAGGQKLAEAAP